MDRTVQVGTVELRVETFGEAAYPAILLIAGGASAPRAWPEEVCARLAAGLRFVIRSGAPVALDTPHSLDELAAQAVGLLDAVAAGHAHIVGRALGGAIARRLAVEHPDRTDTLILISTREPGTQQEPDRSERGQQRVRAWKCRRRWSSP